MSETEDRAADALRLIEAQGERVPVSSIPGPHLDAYQAGRAAVLDAVRAILPALLAAERERALREAEDAALSITPTCCNDDCDVTECEAVRNAWGAFSAAIRRLTTEAT